MFRISHPREAEVANLEIACCVQQQVAGLQVTVENIGRVDVLEAPENLIEEVADVVITESLSLEKFVEVRLHETLDDVDILHGVQGRGPQNVADVDNVFMIEPCQDLYLS